MFLSITNLSQQLEPIVATHGAEWAHVLEPQTELQVDEGAVDVIIVGDKPSVLEQLGEGVKRIAGLIAAIQHRRDARDAGTEAIVHVRITNRGNDAVRVILGDGVTDETLDPSATVEYESDGYIELRELGHAPQQGGTPD
jgi:hypothetical protein